MSIADVVRESLKGSNEAEELPDPMDHALREAERLSDLFSDVKPQLYVVPIERYIGVPVVNRTKLTRG